MRIGFEAKRLFTNYTGLGNYCRFVVGGLAEYIPDNQYSLFTPRRVSNAEVDRIVARNNVRVVEPSGGYAMVPSLWRSWGLSHSHEARQLDLFHGLSQELPFGLRSSVKKVVTVHDLIFMRYPQFYNPIDVSIYTAKAKSACAGADRIVAISGQTAQDVADFLRIDPSRIEVIHQGCHPNFKRTCSAEEKSSVRKKYGLPEAFILSVGTIEQRKNVGSIVDALGLLDPDKRLPVVLVGRRTRYAREVVDRATRKGVSDFVRIIDNAAFSDLPAIYQQATMFVYPSLFEGFGIPLVEALESRIPVITSQGSCFAEAGGPDSHYVATDDPHALAEKMEFVLQDSERNSRIERGWQFARKFEPQIIANRLDRLYRELASTSS